MSAFRAQYYGTCAGCHERITPGDEVVYIDDELVHLEHEAWALRKSAPVDVCTECWLVKPCACQDGQ